MGLDMDKGTAKDMAKDMAKASGCPAVGYGRVMPVGFGSRVTGPPPGDTTITIGATTTTMAAVGVGTDRRCQPAGAATLQ